ncbi:hypothetical protein RN001_004930 [Aquatica leii]|uniref:Uncharacterized protein n=1 Tax=Aquatica leii TaxID=1421715 RepID=A0AAN7SAB3_9COLE|nr:hypothetical protein RN001_004930 [Aquatica leii]
MENWLIKCGTSKESDTRDKDHLDKSECNSRECNSEKENEYESDDETLSMDVTLDASQPKKRKILRQRLNKFSDSWLAIPDFKNWLSKSTTTLSKFQGKHDLA